MANEQSNPGQLADNATEHCTVCSAPMSPDASRCEHCGATRGEQHRCPFCAVVAAPESDSRMRFRCPACGAPRIPLSGGADRLPKDAVEQLRRARSAHASLMAWRVGAAVAAAFGLLSVLILTGIVWLLGPLAVPVIIGYVLCALPFAFGVMALINSGKRNREIDDSLDKAWFEAARELTRTRGMLRASDLEHSLRIDKPQAQNLLVRLASLDEVRSEVTDSGEMALSTRLPPKVRVDPFGKTVLGEEPIESQQADASSRGGKSGA